MNKKVKIGGVGISPAIEKLNQIEKDAVSAMKDAVFEQGMTEDGSKRYEQNKIIEQFHIHFKRSDKF